MHVGFALHDPRFAFWAIVGYGARERAAELGLALSVLPATTVVEQAAAIEHFVRQRVDALIVGPIESDGLIAAIQRANDAGIPIVAVDAEIVGAQVACTVRSDNIRGAELAAHYLIERLGGMGRVVHLRGVLASQSAVHRSQGFHNVVDRHPDVQIAFECSGDWSRESGARLMAEALAVAPDVRAVFAANDPMALGALDAIEAAGRGGHISVVGFDALPDALLAVHNGKMAATVRQIPRSIGAQGVEMAFRIVRGENVPPLVLTDVGLITAGNVVEAALDAMYILPGVLRDLVESTEEQRRLQQEIIVAQQRMIQELSTPIIPISDEILVMPLIGAIDTARSSRVMEAMLEAISEHRAQVIIIDITGVPVVDTNVAHHLLQATRAAQLLGAETILVGIAPEVAQTIVQLGVDLSSVVTRSNLQAGLEYAMARRKGRPGR